MLREFISLCMQRRDQCGDLLYDRHRFCMLGSILKGFTRQLELLFCYWWSLDFKYFIHLKGVNEGLISSK